VPEQDKVIEKVTEEEVTEEEIADEEAEAEIEEETEAEKEQEEHPRFKELTEENARLVRQLLRLKADFENLRRRSKLEKEKLVATANEGLLQDLLPVLDNFERALRCERDEAAGDSFFAGIQMVYQGLMQTLGSHGLKRIEAVGKAFDPTFHEAVFMAGEGGGDLIVLEETQTGYLLKEKVIRHTKVLVGQNEEEEE